MNTPIKPFIAPLVSQSELALALRHVEDMRIIAMGDSSVFGVGDHGNDIPSVGFGWTGRIAHDLKAERFVNVAKNGARASPTHQSITCSDRISTTHGADLHWH